MEEQEPIQLLNKRHVRDDFNCGKPQLDNYIRNQASQDVKRDLSACYVLANEDDNVVQGYYTLSSNSIPRGTFPAKMMAKLPPSYEDLPTILLGRLAIDKLYQGKRLGEFMLINALNRSAELSQALGSLAVIVDPIDDEAKEFYAGYGFILLPGTKRMFIPIKTIEESFLPQGQN